MSADQLERPCPADGCDGSYSIDIGCNVGMPETVYRSTCNHEVDRCAECGDVAVVERTERRMTRTPHAGDPGRTRELSYCRECRDEAVARGDGRR